MQQIYTVGQNISRGMLHHRWTFDETSFSIKRKRIQWAATLHSLAYNGVWPGAIVKSNASEIRGSGEAMLHCDLKLKLLKPSVGDHSLLLGVTIRLGKGKGNRSSPKPITPCENGKMSCHVSNSLFLAIAFADNAFYPELMALGLSPT